MKKLKSEKITVIVMISVFVFLAATLIVGIILDLWLNERGNFKGRIWFTVIVIGIFLLLTSIVYLAVFVSMKEYTKNIAYYRDKDYHNDFNLHIYSCKNARYIRKILFDSRHKVENYKDYEELIFHDYPSNFFKEINNEDSDRVDNIMDFIDSRVIDNVLFFEVKIDYGYAYSYIDTNLKTYGIIVFNNEEIKRRDEINNAKKRIMFESFRIVEEMDKVFDDVLIDNRIIKGKCNDDSTVRDVIIQIKEIIDKY